LHFRRASGHRAGIFPGILPRTRSGQLPLFAVSLSEREAKLTHHTSVTSVVPSLPLLSCLRTICVVVPPRSKFGKVATSCLTPFNAAYAHLGASSYLGIWPERLRRRRGYLPVNGLNRAEVGNRSTLPLYRHSMSSHSECKRRDNSIRLVSLVGILLFNVCALSYESFIHMPFPLSTFFPSMHTCSFIQPFFFFPTLRTSRERQIGEIVAPPLNLSPNQPLNPITDENFHNFFVAQRHLSFSRERCHHGRSTCRHIVSCVSFATEPGLGLYNLKRLPDMEIA
jgi:hypothetical protein